jgi:hypothetical protein
MAPSSAIRLGVRDGLGREAEAEAEAEALHEPLHGINHTDMKPFWKREGDGTRRWHRDAGSSRKERLVKSHVMLVSALPDTVSGSSSQDESVLSTSYSLQRSEL